MVISASILMLNLAMFSCDESRLGSLASIVYLSWIAAISPWDQGSSCGVRHSLGGSHEIIGQSRNMDSSKDQFCRF